MTREEAIRELKQFSGTTRLRLPANFWVALNVAIKALEKEPVLDGYNKGLEVLDKITEEIQTLRNCSCYCSDGIIDDVEDIIDKYRESEDKE